MRRIRKALFAAMIVALFSIIFAINASAAQVAHGAATVIVPVLNLRTGSGMNYEVEARIREGDTVVILDRTNPEWYFVNFQGIVGFVSSEFLGGVHTYEEFHAQGRITGSVVNIRIAPNMSADVLARRPTNSRVNIIGIVNGWYRVQHGSQVGYVRSDLVEITRLGVVETNPMNLSAGQQVVDFAMNYLGTRYTFGGTSPNTGFDCSGFMVYVFRSFGIYLTRSSANQFRNDGIPIERHELVPGDLVFFTNNSARSVSHVGMYIGGGEMIHSSTHRTGVIITSIESPQRVAGFVGARRVL